MRRKLSRRASRRAFRANAGKVSAKGLRLQRGGRCL